MALSWLDEFFTTSAADDLNVPSKVAVLTTVATTANQVITSAPGIATATLGFKNLYRVYAEVSGTNSAGDAIAGSVDGTFKISDAGVLTRVGTDVVVAARGTLTPTLSLQISGSTINVCVTPSSVTSTGWKVTVQTTKYVGAPA